MVGAAAVVALRTADDDAARLATRLHHEMSVNIRMRLDDYRARSPSPIDPQNEDTLVSLLRSQAVGTNGRAFILDRTGKMIVSSAPDGDPVVESAVAARGVRNGAHYHFCTSAAVAGAGSPLAPTQTCSPFRTWTAHSAVGVRRLARNGRPTVLQHLSDFLGLHL
jgi:hypothetical protein